MDRSADRHATIGTAINHKPLTHIDMGYQFRMLEPKKKKKKIVGQRKGVAVSGYILKWSHVLPDYVQA